MRYLHSKGVIHRNLTPDNILLDGDWSVRIAGFGRSISPDRPAISSASDPTASHVWRSGDPRYLTPERYDDVCVPKSDVFSFGLILCELIVGAPAFPKGASRAALMRFMIREHWRPDIPDSVLPSAVGLIRDCWATDHFRRPSFSEILDRLSEMDFKPTPNAHSAKIAAFVAAVENREAANPAQLWQPSSIRA
jgi:serine/threonine-protein kinase CTR1